MTRAIRPTLLLVLGAAAITMALLLTGVLGGTGPSPAGAATARQHAPTQPAQRHTARHIIRKHSTRHATKRTTARSAQTGDSDNVQAGDQNAPDNPSGENETAGENENAGEIENESANEPAGVAQPGHEDPGGQQVDHQCPPDCAPGELP